MGWGGGRRGRRTAPSDISRSAARDGISGLEPFGFRPETKPRFGHFLSAKKDHSAA